MGLELCTGSVVGFLDSDDRYRANHVEILLEVLKDQKLDFVVGSFDVIGSEGDPIIPDYFNPGNTILLSEAECSTGLLFGYKAAFKQAGPFETKFADINMFLRLKEMGLKWQKVHEKTYEYYFGLCENSILVQMLESKK